MMVVVATKVFASAATRSASLQKVLQYPRREFELVAYLDS